MPFPDFPFHETEASFVHHTDVLRYLKEYAQHYGLYEHIKVRHNSLYISLLKDRIWGLVVRVPGYITEKNCVSCEVRTEFMYVM
jgi:cation diffusion facilitator CzcD-associated flavoprotein CzcO